MNIKPYKQTFEQAKLETLPDNYIEDESKLNES